MAWQFGTPTDRAAKMYIKEASQCRLNRSYSALVYSTFIDRKYNYFVKSTATGNLSSANPVANAPSSTSHSSDPAGNESRQIFSTVSRLNPKTRAAFGPRQNETLHRSIVFPVSTSETDMRY